MTSKRRRRRGPVTLDQGEGLGVWYDPRTWFDTTALNWQPSPRHPDMDFVIVPNDTPKVAEVAAWSIDDPAPGKTTWYKISDRAWADGRAQAAIDTIAAVGAQISDTAGQVFDVGASILKNIVPILIGIAVLYLFSHMDESK